jgi:hypothetical protein
MMVRILRVVLLMLWLELGIILILVPWSRYWDSNYFVYRYPALGLIVNSSYFRGTMSGLGIVNVFLALEAFRRRTSALAERKV